MPKEAGQGNYERRQALEVVVEGKGAEEAGPTLLFILLRCRTTHYHTGHISYSLTLSKSSTDYKMASEVSTIERLLGTWGFLAWKFTARRSLRALMHKRMSAKALRQSELS